MELGGVEKELITVLKKIHKQYDITLLLLYQDDIGMLKDIPKDVKIRIVGLEKDYYIGSSYSLIKQRLKKGHIIEATGLGIKRCLKIGMTGANINLSGIPFCEAFFDVAICYHIHSPLMLKYVAEKVQAQKKVAWIHNDFYESGYPIQRLKKYVMVYDGVVAVSQKVENEFRRLCPWYAGQISTAYNYLDEQEIYRRSSEMIEEADFLYEKEVKLLTVGRFTEQKGIDLAIMSAAMLKKEKLKFHWYLIGYGPLENLYRKLIVQHDVADCFTILGRKENPYPYIKNCDIYVQPSRHEAYSLVMIEAKILKRPIVCTDFDGADEQINNEVNGIIVPLNDIKALSEAISRLIMEPKVRESFSKQLEKWSQGEVLQEIVKHLK